MPFPRNIIGVTLNLSLLLVCASPAQATGPSHLEIEIVPFGVDKSGAVLFKTKRIENAMGAHTILAVSAQYGWLCVSSAGVWEEHIHTRIMADEVGKSGGSENLVVLPNNPQGLVKLIGYKPLTS